MSTTVHAPTPLTIADMAQIPAPGMALPNQCHFSPDGSMLYFLAPDEPGGPQHLYAIHSSTGTVTRLASAPDGGISEASLSLEEELRRQRERSHATGITRFSMARRFNQILLPGQNQLYLLDVTDTAQVASPRLIVDAGAATIQFPTFSPDGKRVAWVQDAELMTLEIATGNQLQLTHDARETGKTNGLADYLAQEELDRMEGFWWSPDSKAIAYLQVDEAHVPVYTIMHQGDAQPTNNETHHYPFAGGPNPSVKLGIVSRSGRKRLWVDLDLPFEWYLGRVFWWPDGDLGAYILDRSQKEGILVRFNRNTGARTPVLREQNDLWISLRHTLLYPLSDGRFIWASERSGYNHLYAYDRDGTLVRQLTHGDWQVDDIVGVDERKRLVYFTGNRESPLDKQLYSVTMQDGLVDRITRKGSWHEVVLDRNCKRYCDIAHSTTERPTVSIRSLASNVAMHQLPDILDDRPERFDLAPPEFVTIPTRDGVNLYGAIYHPDAERYGPGPYPTIVDVYGGPGVQHVTNSWAMTVRLQRQYFREQGYLVFSLDNRGSTRRGLTFEGSVKYAMGTVEVRDQVDGVRWLVDRGLADQSRVGVTGWSYGGYMTLMCLCQAPDVFKAGVAGAPVTAWDGYDTAYTERYMGMPQDQPEAYRTGSVMAHVDGLQGKLLIIHGMLDENVHFRHTVRLINALNRARKPYDLLILPDERHSPRFEQDRIALQEKLVAYFRANL